MRLLQLRANGADSAVLEFHPSVTVVSGLSAGARAQVVRALEALPTGSDPGFDGLVEAHGVLFDLNPETLDQFGLGTSVDVVVRPDDLPGTLSLPPSPPPEPRPAPVMSGIEQIALIKEELVDATEAYDVLKAAHDRAKAQVAAAGDARSRIMSALDKARAARDQARAKVEADGLAEATSDEEDAMVRRVEELEHTLQEVQRAVGILEDRDPRPVEVLVAEYRKPPSEELVPSKEAIALADEMVELRGKLAEIEDRLDREGRSPDQALERLDAARAALAEAQKAVAKPELSPEDDAELEAAHERVLEAEQKASGRVGRKAARRKLAEAQAAEQEILDRIGFPTWTAYVMGASMLNVDPMAEQGVEEAQAKLEEAEATWARLTEELENDPEYREVLDQLEAVHLVAFDLLGGDDGGDIEGRLREMMVPEEEVPKEDILDALIYQLGLVGVEIPEGSPADVVLPTAEDYLADHADHWEQWQKLKQDEERLEGELEATRREQQRVSAQRENSSQSTEERRAELEQAEAVVNEILTDLEQATELESELAGQVDAREAMMSASKIGLDMIQARLDAAVEGVTSAAAVPSAEPKDTSLYESLPYAEHEEGDADGSDAGLEEIEFYILSRFAQVRSLSHAGSVPLVLDDALGALPVEDRRKLLDKLHEMAESVQVIYLTDDRDVSSWADSMGLERAAVVQAHGEFAS